jgi:hypothetical protein
MAVQIPGRPLRLRAVTRWLVASPRLLMVWWLPATVAARAETFA